MASIHEDTDDLAAQLELEQEVVCELDRKIEDLETTIGNMVASQTDLQGQHEQLLGQYLHAQDMITTMEQDADHLKSDNSQYQARLRSLEIAFQETQDQLRADAAELQVFREKRDREAIEKAIEDERERERRDAEERHRVEMEESSFPASSSLPTQASKHSEDPGPSVSTRPDLRLYYKIDGRLPLVAVPSKKKMPVGGRLRRMIENAALPSLLKSRGKSNHRSSKPVRRSPIGTLSLSLDIRPFANRELPPWLKENIPPVVNSPNNSLPPPAIHRPNSSSFVPLDDEDAIMNAVIEDDTEDWGMDDGSLDDDHE